MYMFCFMGALRKEKNWKFLFCSSYTFLTCVYLRSLQDYKLPNAGSVFVFVFLFFSHRPMAGTWLALNTCVRKEKLNELIYDLIAIL